MVTENSIYEFKVASKAVQAVGQLLDYMSRELIKPEDKKKITKPLRELKPYIVLFDCSQNCPEKDSLKNLNDFLKINLTVVCEHTEKFNVRPQ